MFSFIITMIIIVCVLLVLVILAQNSKGGGLSSQFGGSSTSNLIGVKKTGDILEKITWSLAIALVVLSMSTTFLIDPVTAGGINSENVERAKEQQQTLPSLDLPADDATNEDGLEGLQEESSQPDTTGN